MSDDINYHFPDFLLANQSKNVFAKHAVDLANKCMSLETLPIRIIIIMFQKKNLSNLKNFFRKNAKNEFYFRSNLNLEIEKKTTNGLLLIV